MTFFYFVIISLCNFLHTAESVTSSFGAMHLDENTLRLDKFVSENGHFFHCNEKGDVIIPDAFALTWSGDGVYEIQAAGNIIFKPNVRIEYTGSGGGLILRPYYTKDKYQYSSKNVSAGTLIFEEGSQPIDFSQSRNSAISIFYRPSGTYNKYANPRDFSPHIRLPEDQTKRDSIYVEAFMLVENKDDFRNTSQFEGNYALGQTIEIDQRVESDRLALMPNSILNMNHFDWAKKWNVDGQDFDLFVLGRSFSKSLACSPPYVDFKKALLQAAQTGDMSAFEGRWFYDCRLTEGSTRRNLLHVAAANGHTHFLQKAHESITRRSGLIIDNWHFFLHLVTASDREGNTALDLAAFGGHLGTINWLVGILKEKANVSVSIQKVEAAARANPGDASDLEQPYERTINYLRGLNEIQGFGKYWLGYPITRAGFEEEYRYAQYTNQRFFIRNVGTTKTTNFLERFKEEYKQFSASSFGLEGIPSRSRIILFPNVGVKKIKKKDTSRFQNGEDKFPTGYRVQQDPDVTVVVRNNPTTNQPGNVYLIGIPRYNPGEIPASINQIVGNFPYQGSQKIAALMRQSRLLGMPITTEHLLEQGYAGTTPQEDAIFLNKLGLLLSFEVSRKLPEQPTLPIGISCARAFTLIEKGYLTWDQFLTKDKPYHFFSGYRKRRSHICY